MKQNRAAIRFFLVFVFIWCIPVLSFSEQVTTSDRVESGVNIREAASSDGTVIGVLSKGDKLKFVESVPYWHKVLLNDGREGYVSKSWTVLIPDSPESPSSIPFAVHFVDVGTGDAIIIDMGDKEIVIDGGESTTVLADYIKSVGLIDGPIELVVVTHGDSDHWKGLARLLGTDGVLDAPYAALEFWEPRAGREKLDRDISDKAALK